MTGWHLRLLHNAAGNPTHGPGNWATSAMLYRHARPPTLSRIHPDVDTAILWAREQAELHGGTVTSIGGTLP